jgi:limonene-1,2-epoxide hydrolase
MEGNMRKGVFLIAMSLMLGAASLATAANAPTILATKTELDTTNIGVVKAFIAGWGANGRGAEYLSDKASVRMEEDKPAITGKKAYMDAWAALQPGQTVKVAYHEVIARHPVVVTRRTDTLVTPGKPDQTYEIVGVFVVKDKKIVEWTDYVQK